MNNRVHAAPVPTAERAVQVVENGLIWIFVIVVYLVLYAPMIVMAAFSFNDSKAQTLPYSGLTTRWYRDFFSDAEIHQAIFYSLRVAALAVTIGVVMGVLFAMIIQRMKFPGKNLFVALVAIPLALPGIVLGISLLIVFHTLGVDPGYFTIVLGHASFVTPLIMFIVLQRLRTFDMSLEQASMDLGANWIKTFWHITLPELRITILAAALLGFTISVDEITVTLFLAGIQLTLPVFVWTLLRFGFTPEVNAAFTIIGLGSVILIVIAGLLLVWGSGRRRQVVVEEVGV